MAEPNKCFAIAWQAHLKRVKILKDLGTFFWIFFLNSRSTSSQCGTRCRAVSLYICYFSVVKASNNAKRKMLSKWVIKHIFWMSVAKNALFLVSGKIIPFRLNRIDHYFYALAVEKQLIYKLTCELVDLLFLKKIFKICASL